MNKNTVGVIADVKKANDKYFTSGSDVPLNVLYRYSSDLRQEYVKLICYVDFVLNDDRMDDERKVCELQDLLSGIGGGVNSVMRSAWDDYNFE
jgi:hypothetical protein